MELFALLIIAAAALIAFLTTARPRPRSRKYYPGRRSVREQTTDGASAPRSPPTHIGDSADQLRIVMQAPFQKTRLMSKPEYDVFRVVEVHLRQCGPGYRLMAQTSMGEILTSSNEQAFRCINSKRVDMLVIDALGFAVVAIEQQGSGHYQRDAAARDAVKREALRKAGVEFLEIFSHHQPEDIRRLVSDAIARSKPPSVHTPDAPTVVAIR